MYISINIRLRFETFHRIRGHQSYKLIPSRQHPHTCTKSRSIASSAFKVNHDKESSIIRLTKRPAFLPTVEYTALCQGGSATSYKEVGGRQNAWFASDENLPYRNTTPACTQEMNTIISIILY